MTNSGINQKETVTKMLEKYNKLTKDFENWKDNNLNTAEASYYLDVQTRVTKKLLEITNQ